MQMFIYRTKLVIFAVLGCSLLITLNGGNIETSTSFVDKPKTFKTRQSVKSARMISVISAASPKVAPSSSNSLSSTSLWSNLRQELKLDHKAQSSQVQAEIRKLLAEEGKLYSILKAAGPYIYFIHKQTQKRGLPAELALIPVIESEFNPNDRSKKGATGLWQLMPPTARELGIKVKSHYDGRRNVVASTKAALAYFYDLGNLFKGNWYLAIAAYNCGQMKVKSVQRRTGSNSFWNLPLPKETKHYVPKLLAVAAIVKNPEKYGVKLPHIENEPYFTELKVTKSVNLAQIAESSGVSVETMHKLNPDYNHGHPLPDKGAYTLLVPAKKTSVVKAKIKECIVVS